jgi:hypothetical protein
MYVIASNLKYSFNLKYSSVGMTTCMYIIASKLKSSLNLKYSNVGMTTCMSVIGSELKSSFNLKLPLFHGNHKSELIWNVHL